MAPRPRVLLAIDRDANREQLADWLAAWETVDSVSEPVSEEALGRCDLCLVDGPTFRRHRETLAGGKDAARPVFLPYLLVRTDGGAGEPWGAVDDVIDTPVGQAELRGRIEVLLRARDYSVELKRRNDRLDEFAGTVSHDLRNPLTIARGFLETARESGDPDHFDRVDRALDRMEEIVDDLLSLARSGTAIGEREPVALATAVRTAWASVATGEATLDLDLDLDDVSVSGDESRIVELLENLFRNAVEHGGAAVSVRVGELGGQDGFYVEDDGPGIPADARAAVFEYGYSTDDDGTGFGLAIVEGIAEAHGWSVGLAESPAGGARFEVRTEPAVPGRSTPAGPPVGRAGERPR